MLFKDLEVLFDLFATLSESFEEGNQKQFETIVHPLYLKTGNVFHGYEELLLKLRNMIEQKKSREELIRILEEGRLEHLSLRLKKKKILRNKGYRVYSSDHLFLRGVWGIICCSLSAFDEMPQKHAYSIPEHTILDRLYQIPIDLYAECCSSNPFCTLFDERQEEINTAWQDVIQGYRQIETTVGARTQNESQPYVCPDQ